MADTLTTTIEETFGPCCGRRSTTARCGCGKAHSAKHGWMKTIVKAQDGLEQLCLKETTNETSYDDTCIVCCPSVGSVCDDIAFCSETRTSTSHVVGLSASIGDLRWYL